ncbi:Yip1 family protein [Halorarum salinum]|uniref:YIP1 family protein n=1 Tax=Halorarum salinum TaxID=2743089 RepID=A0A7D5L8H6_9EURY|nr:Yip1 family protein [Halobaculum salinum]QLG60450.1 YIP1 family protein [Halobaculum salinum]
MSGPRTPLLRPQSYFESHDGSPPLGHAALAVAVVAVVTAGGIGLFLAEFAGALDATVEMENPEHSPEWACENFEGSGMSTPSGCDPSVPETVERDLGSLVYEELSWLPWAALFIVPIFWAVQALVLHAGAAVIGGEGTFADTLAVAGWGMVPSLARVLALGALLIYRLRTTPLPGDPEGAVAALEAAFSGLGAASMVAVLVVAVWAGAVRVYGLAETHDVPVGEALVVVAVTTLVGFVFEAL